jgi:rod shape-determining protein MreC
VIVAALIALIQLDAAKTGKPSLITVAVASTAAFVETGIAAVGGGASNVVATLGDAPRLYARIAELSASERALRAENARLREALAQAPVAEAVARTLAAAQAGIAADVVGYDPENLSRTITLDRGSDAGVRVDDGVIDPDGGVVGRVDSVTPFASSVVLITDGSSKIPAVVQRGRWWGLATGTNAHVRIQYVSQDAKLKAGDVVVTGTGRSFRAGLTIGTIGEIDRPEGALYQSAVLATAADFGRLTHVVVLPHA